MADIDELLKGSFERLAEREDSAGVADLIRARVAAGDTGTPATGSTAPGWVPPRPRWFWPLVATVAGLATVVAVLLAVVAWPVAPDPEPTIEPSSTPSASPTPTVTPTPTASPTVTPTPTTDPGTDAPPPPPPAPRDQVAPTITAGQWSPGFVYGSQTPCGGTTSDIVVTATDDVALASISTATTLAGTTVTQIATSGSSYTYRFTGTWPPSQQDTLVTVTFTARDAAGNASSVATSITNAVTCIT